MNEYVPFFESVKVIVPRPFPLGSIAYVVALNEPFGIATGLLFPDPLALELLSSIRMLVRLPPLNVARRREKTKLPVTPAAVVGIVPVCATASPTLAAGKSVRITRRRPVFTT